MADSREPLLSTKHDQNYIVQHHEVQHHEDQDQLHSLLISTTNTISFVPDADDIPPINGIRDFLREFYIEFKKLWYLAGPAIFTCICQYSLGAVTQIFSGQVGTLALAAVSVENSVISGFSFGAMVTTSKTYSFSLFFAFHMYKKVSLGLILAAWNGKCA